MPVSNQIDLVGVIVLGLTQELSRMPLEHKLVSWDTVLCELQELTSKVTEDIL